MSVANIIAENYSVFHKTFIFFMRLAYRYRITLPYMIMIGFMVSIMYHCIRNCFLPCKVLDIRPTLEIIIDVEHHTPDESGVNDEDIDIDSDQEPENYELED